MNSDALWRSSLYCALLGPTKLVISRSGTVVGLFFFNIFLILIYFLMFLYCFDDLILKIIFKNKKYFKKYMLFYFKI